MKAEREGFMANWDYAESSYFYSNKSKTCTVSDTSLKGKMELTMSNGEKCKGALVTKNIAVYSQVSCGIGSVPVFAGHVPVVDYKLKPLKLASHINQENHGLGIAFLERNSFYKPPCFANFGEISCENDCLEEFDTPGTEVEGAPYGDKDMFRSVFCSRDETRDFLVENGYFYGLKISNGVYLQASEILKFAGISAEFDYEKVNCKESKPKKWLTPQIPEVLTQIREIKVLPNQKMVWVIEQGTDSSVDDQPGKTSDTLSVNVEIVDLPRRNRFNCTSSYLQVFDSDGTTSLTEKLCHTKNKILETSGNKVFIKYKTGSNPYGNWTNSGISVSVNKKSLLSMDNMVPGLSKEEEDGARQLITNNHKMAAGRILEKFDALPWNVKDLICEASCE